MSETARDPGSGMRIAGEGLSGGLARLPTSLKLFAILTLALLPLGIIALLASLQTTRTADAQRRADLQVAVGESSRKLGAELISDLVVLGQAVRTAAQEPGSSGYCDRPSAILAARQDRPVRIAIYGPAMRPLCWNGGRPPDRPAVDIVAPRPSAKVVGNEVELVVPSAVTNVLAVARYPASTLARLARPAGFSAPYHLALESGSQSVTLLDNLPSSPFARVEQADATAAFPDLKLTMTIASAPFGATEFLITFLPLVMWASAALVGYYVVDNVLVRPLKTLRADVAQYQPDRPIPLTARGVPAIEIGQLRQSFADFADRLLLRENDLEAALANQMRLTREVHHRVKNNLQVIASLVSLHARGNAAATIPAAFAIIQRRVDALAIVHRNHFAELEQSQGIDVRAMLGELATNFRANAAEFGIVPQIVVDSRSAVVDQDVAMPLAFLFTELAESSLLADARAALSVRVASSDEDGRAIMTVASAAFQAMTVETASIYAMRIVEGLARQLRAPLVHDDGAGSYAIAFPLMKSLANN